jgi:hypothetical protein
MFAIIPQIGHPWERRRSETNNLNVSIPPIFLKKDES